MTSSTSETFVGLFFKLTITLLILLALLFKLKNPLQYHVKSIFYIILMVLSGIIYLPVSVFRPKNTLNFVWLKELFKFLVNLFYDIHYTVENEHHLKSDKPYIILCNHQSSLDILTMSYAWPIANCTVLAKKELLYTGPMGWTFWLSGMTFIDRLNPDRSRGTIDKLADRLNKENLRVWIYPEGTRSMKRKFLPFKKGAFHLAIQAQIPIVCVVVSSYLNFYDKREKKFKSHGDVKVRYLEPIETKGMSIDQVNQLLGEVQSRMQSEYDKLNEEIQLEKKYYDESLLNPTIKNTSKAGEQQEKSDLNNNETK